MKARSAIVSLICATALILAGCSTGVAGVPQLPGAAGASGTSGSSGGSAGSAPQTSQQGPAANGGESGDDGESGLPSANGGISGLPTDLGDLPTDLGDLPTNLGSLPTNLGSIPGLNTECLAIAGTLLSLPLMFMGPMLGGQPLTQEQVDQAFGSLGDVPGEIQQPVQVLHQAAVQAIGKSGEEAAAVLDSDEVDQALDAINNYAEAKCGGS